MFNAMMVYANSNGYSGMYKPIDVGSMETLTGIRDKISEYINQGLM